MDLIAFYLFSERYEPHEHWMEQAHTFKYIFLWEVTSQNWGPQPSRPS